jgi:hypothetical protein
MLTRCSQRQAEPLAVSSPITISSNQTDEEVEAAIGSPQACRDFKQVALVARRLARGRRGKGSGGRPAKRARRDHGSDATAAQEDEGAEEEDEGQEDWEVEDEEGQAAAGDSEPQVVGRRGRGRGKAAGRGGPGGAAGRRGRGAGPYQVLGQPGGWQVALYRRASGSQAGKTWRRWTGPDGANYRSLVEARRAGFSG